MLTSLYSHAMIWRLFLPFLDHFTSFIMCGFGAHIGSNVLITRGDFFDPWLLEIGDNTIIGHNSLITGHYFENGNIVWGKICIGKDCTVGSRAIISPGVTLEDGVILGAQSFVGKDEVLSKGTYAGVPARLIQAHKS